MIWTTSRYAPEALRQSASRLARLYGGRYVARGKKTVSQLVEFARAQGHRRIMIIETSGGKKPVVRCIEALPAGGFRWFGVKGVDEFEGKGEL